MTKLLWKPSESQIKKANITRFMKYVNEKYNLSITNYPQLYEWSEVPEIIMRKPRKTVEHSGCITKNKALVFKLTDIFNSSENGKLQTTITKFLAY